MLDKPAVQARIFTDLGFEVVTQDNPAAATT
jgi:hypothetical protein